MAQDNIEQPIMEDATRTYSGFIGWTKVSLVIVALVTILVVVLIS